MMKNFYSADKDFKLKIYLKNIKFVIENNIVCLSCRWKIAKY